MSGLLIAANWKMMKTSSEARAFFQDFLSRYNDTENDVLICPPFVHLDQACQFLKDTPVSLGAQTMSYAEEGAYTGEISPKMITDFGCSHVILGHSERRSLFGESNDIVNQKAHLALRYEIIPIVCVGETREERDSGRALDVVKSQCEGSLANLDIQSGSQLVIAYEPVWAIGTGLVASPDDAQAVHRFIREWLTDRFSATISSQIRLLYGGSVKPANCRELMVQHDINGALVGSASLNPGDFWELVVGG